ncbi:outer membrane protein assembly factor BamB family protein [Blastococcus tunisiensis]|uniref:PQQ-like domain-containing protein n=1 Tax=Blastococcus tunisiensis TaxID=1798228 RepID=A0A1I1WPW7_9ACTN|nr:PQQ-binding-like beta-propeller repeat protein [Blastococcus sp. DSM 46838]SFD97176.1 PQQ-like domain-containing protein [Blastococcus sp. DSM 46838]
MSGVRRPPLRVWVWTAATVALLLVAALLWRGSDAAATRSTTAPPADVPSGTPAGAVSEAWSAGAGLAPERLVAEGRVLLGSGHGVRALDPLTGEQAWHYTRSDARLCGLTATDGVAVAVFATADRCDEAVALDAGTGVRRWTRNLNLAGDAVLDSTSAIVLASNPTGVLTFDPTGSGIRWRSAAPAGCRFLDSDTGSTGVVVLQRCTGSTDVRVRLLDGFAGTEHWTRTLPADGGEPVGLLGADGTVTVRVGAAVHTLSGPDGTELARQPVAPATADVDQVTVGSVSLVRIGGVVTARDTASGAALWEAPATGLPVDPGTKDAARPGRLVLPDPAGFSVRDLLTGAELSRSAAGAPPRGGTAATVGPAVVLRADERVLGYR